jgi:iron complex transport system ATP-binding protein
MGKPEEVFTQRLIRNLYEVDVEMQSLYGGKARVCIPKCALS